MSRKNNVNPDHYKVAGRDRQGEDTMTEIERRKYAEALRLKRRRRKA